MGSVGVVVSGQNGNPVGWLVGWLVSSRIDLLYHAQFPSSCWNGLDFRFLVSSLRLELVEVLLNNS